MNLGQRLLDELDQAIVSNNSSFKTYQFWAINKSNKTGNLMGMFIHSFVVVLISEPSKYHQIFELQ